MLERLQSEDRRDVENDIAIQKNDAPTDDDTSHTRSQVWKPVLQSHGKRIDLSLKARWKRAFLAELPLKSGRQRFTLGEPGWQPSEISAVAEPRPD